MVNVAYDAPIDAPPAVQIEDTEQKLYDLAETGKYGSGFEPFTTALTDAIDMAANAYRRDGGLSGLRPPASPTSTSAWVACTLPI